MRYDAFISYRHSELDQFVAENLHKKLESFRLPNSIVKQRGKDCKKKIERVFRDRDELPLATNLADPITVALENSEFLIVICSPRLPQSLWCKKEIETFIDLHRRERVLAVLVEGEPDESFPEELLYRNREITHEDGTVEIIKEPVEPLAADVRGNSKKEILKKMDEELLRLGAAMFNCAYDDLKQRHKEQKMKKMLTASLAASAFFLVFGAVSTTMAIRIQSQKEQIQAQSEEIQAQKEEIEVQYQQALYNQSLSMADDSLALLAKGDRLGALQVACAALGVTEDGTSMPVTAEAQLALAESSYLYRDGESLIPLYMFKHDANIYMMQVSPNGERLLTGDQYGNVFVWDILQHKLLAQFSGNYLSYASEEDCFFLNDDQILYSGMESFAIFDIDKQETVYTGENFFVKGYPSGDGSRFAVVTDEMLNETLWVYDADGFLPLYSYVVPEGKMLSNTMKFDEENSILVFCLQPDIMSEEHGSTIVVMDLNNGEIMGEIPAEYSYIGDIRIVEDVIYVGVNQSLDDASPDGDYDLSMPLKSKLYAISKDGLSVKWVYENEYETISNIQINPADFSRHIMVSYYSEAHILGLDTGASEHELAFGDQIVTPLYYLNSDRFAVITRDGEYHIINGSTGEDIVFTGYFQTNSTNLQDILLTMNGFVSLPYSSCDVTYYELAVGPDFEVVAERENNIQNVHVNEAEDRAVITYSGLYMDNQDEVTLLDLQTGDVIADIWLDDYGVNAGMVADGSELFYILTYDKMMLYSVKDGSFSVEYPLPETIIPDSVAVSTDGESLILRDTRTFWKLNFADGSYESQRMIIDGYEPVTANVSNDFSVCAIADKEENAIMLYSMGGEGEYEEDAFVKIDVVAAFVDDILFTKDNKYLLAYYMDGSADLFNVESGMCIKEYGSFGGSLEAIDSLEDDQGYLLKTTSGGFLLNNAFEVIASMTECEAIKPKAKELVGVDDNILYTCPIYTTEQLLDKAEEILTGLNAYE